MTTLKKKIKQALTTNIEYGAGVYRNGPITVTWFPDEKRGIVDVGNPDNVTGRKGFYQLKQQALTVINQLPEGIWEFNPDTPRKGLLYQKLFKDIAQPNPDMPNNALVYNNEYKYLGKVPRSVFEQELEAYQTRRAGGNELGIKKVPAQFEYNGELFTIQSKGGGGYHLKRSSERAQKEATREATKLRQSPKLSSIEQKMVQNYYEDATLRGLQVDHEIPLEKGGLHHPSNMRLLTPSANAAKGAKLGTSFATVPLLDDVARAIGAIPKPALGFIPVAGSAFDVAEAAERTQRASQQPTLINKLQAGIAQVGAATTLNPTPPAQAVNIGAGLTNVTLDWVKDIKKHSQEVMRAIGQADFTRLLGY